MHAWLNQLDQHFPVRYSAWLACAIGWLLFSFTWVAFGVGGLAAHNVYKLYWPLARSDSFQPVEGVSMTL